MGSGVKLKLYKLLQRTFKNTLKASIIHYFITFNGFQPVIFANKRWGN